MTNSIKTIAYELLGALEDLVHDIDVYEFLNDFDDFDDDDDMDFKKHVDNARTAIAKARGEEGRW